MVWTNHRFFRNATLLALMLWPTMGFACNVPVFRYALERWTVDTYDAVIFYNEPLDGAQQAGVERMEKMGQSGQLNLTVTKVNLSSEPPQILKTLWQAQTNPVLPWIVLRYPPSAHISSAVWSGPLNKENAEAIVDSPARQELTRKLLGGDAIVWLCLESGNPQQDHATATWMETELRKLEQTLVLPASSPLDPPINTNRPLKISCSMVHVSRGNPAEQMLVNLLLHWHPTLISNQDGLIFPIFGRGRMLLPAAVPQVNSESLRRTATFLTGPCSCEIKEQNPGCDLLLAAPWDSVSGYQEIMVPELPPLVGISQFAAQTAAASNSLNAQSKIDISPPPLTTVNTRSSSLIRNLLLVAGSGIAFLAIGTWLIKAKNRPGS